MFPEEDILMLTCNHFEDDFKDIYASDNKRSINSLFSLIDGVGYLSVIILSKTKSNWSFVVKSIKLKKQLQWNIILPNYNRRYS